MSDDLERRRLALLAGVDPSARWRDVAAGLEVQLARVDKLLAGRIEEAREAACEVIDNRPNPDPETPRSDRWDAVVLTALLVTLVAGVAIGFLLGWVGPMVPP